MEPNQESNEIAEHQGESRRSFLAKLGLGAAALTLVSSSLGFFGRKQGVGPSARHEFPDEDSIFHPASDPRTDPRRRS